MYYSCCFSVCNRAAAQRGSWVGRDGYVVSPPSGRRWSGGVDGHAGGVVVPAGAGLVPPAPCRPAELEGKAGEAEYSGFPVAGQALDAGGLGGGQPDRGDAGRAGLASPGGQRRGAGIEQQVSGAGGGLAGGGRGGAAGGRCRGEDVSAGERGLDGGGPQLGQGGQRGVAADRLVGPGLALVPAEGVLSRLERNFSRPLLIPVKKKSSLAFRVHPGRY